MTIINDSRCPDSGQFMSQLGIIENSISFYSDFKKISNFFENNREYMAQDREVALHCDSIATKVRLIKSDSPLISKMQDVVGKLLPKDERVHESLAFIRQSKSPDQGLANWINTMEIPLASLNLKQKELENVLPLLTYIDLTDFNGFFDEGYYKLISNPNLKLICQDATIATEIALQCAKQNGRDTALYIQNFGIKEESILVAIALECAKQNGSGTAGYIQNFGIKKESSLVAIAFECAKQSLDGYCNIQNFGIKEESRVTIALFCAKQNGEKTSQFIKKFWIKEERSLVAIALECAKQNGKGTAKYIRNFGIKEESSLGSIALECAKQDGKGTAEFIQNFGIQDAQIRYKVFMECMKQNEESLFLIDNFKFPQGNLATLSKVVQVLKSNEEEQEQRNALFTAVRSSVKDLPCSDDSKLIIEKKIDKIAKLKPHTQNRAVLWMFRSLSYMDSAEPSTLDWMMGNGLWNELGDLRRPALRGLLTPSLFNLASTENKKEWDDFITAMNEKKQARLALLSLTLPPASAKTISTLKVGKNSSLNDVHKFTTFLEASYLVSASGLLSSEQKASGFVKVIPDKQGSDDDYQRKLIKNATAAKGLLQLKSINWAESEEDLGLLFRNCFEELIPLKGFEGDAAAKYDEIFGSSRNPGGLLTYAAGLKTLNDPQVMDCLGQFVAAVFRGDFKEMRYDILNHPHLAKIAEAHPDILKMWKEGIQVNVEGVKGGSKDVFNLKNWVSTKLTVDKHLGDADLKYVVKYLNAQSDEQKKAISKEVLDELQALMKGKKKTEVNADPACVNLKLQMECMKLVRGGEEADLASFKNEFLEIQRLLGLKYPESIFARDVEGIIQSFEKSKEAPKVLRAVLTDDPIDWMQCGTDVAGSCQRLDGLPDLNKGLLGYMMDGKNRLLVIKDDQGEIVARTLLSILWDGEKPVLYRERFYPDTTSANERHALNQAAKQFADTLNIPLTENAGNGDTYEKPLQALGGPAPYEYSDASGGIQANGRYTIDSAKIL